MKLKCAHSPLNLRLLSSTSVPFTLTTVQVPNLALTHTKRITVYDWLLMRNAPSPSSRLDLRKRDNLVNGEEVGGRKEPNHTTARKPGLLYYIKYALVLKVNGRIVEELV